MANEESKLEAGTLQLPVSVQRIARQIYALVRRDIRSNELAQIVLCGIWGGIVGAVVVAMHGVVLLLHRIDFAITGDNLLSTGIGVDRIRILFVPALGGLLLGGIAIFMRRYRNTDIVDPVEANALYGGRMSLWDSIRLAGATVLSNGAGASLGMEAGYTQLGSGIFSTVGDYFRLRRADLRIFVTAGAAAAIAAAFNAPLAGTFYGYELILGSYTPVALAPVALAAICAALVRKSGWAIRSPGFTWRVRRLSISGATRSSAPWASPPPSFRSSSMTAVTWVERGMRRAAIADWLRPCIGGIALSAIAFAYPQVLGSGHGGIQFHFETRWGLAAARGVADRENLRVGDFGRQRIPRRPVQFVAVPGLHLRRGLRAGRRPISILRSWRSVLRFCWSAWAQWPPASSARRSRWCFSFWKRPAIFR